MVSLLKRLFPSPPEVETLISNLRSASTRDVSQEQADAMNALVKSGTRTVGPLIEVLSDENRIARRNAMIVLGKIPNGTSIVPIARACLKEGYQENREAGILALATIGKRYPFASLLALFIAAKDSTVVHDVIKALIRMREPRALEIFIEALAHGVYGTYQYACARGIQDILEQDIWQENILVATLEQVERLYSEAVEMQKKFRDDLSFNYVATPSQAAYGRMTELGYARDKIKERLSEMKKARTGADSTAT
jgi:HEAT repeat protein